MALTHNTTFEDSSPLIQYTGDWLDSPPNVPDFSKYSGYAAPDFASFHATNITGATFALPFNGTAVYIFGTVGPTGGPFSTTLTSASGANQSTATIPGDSHADQTSYQTLLYSGTKLDDSMPHVLNVTVGSGQFILDYVVVESAIPGRFQGPMTNWTLDDTNPAFSYGGGTWASELPQSTNNTFYPHIYNGTSQSSDDVGAQARIDFNGTGVEIHGRWLTGGLTATVDGVTLSDLLIEGIPYGTKAGVWNRPRELLFAADGLEYGNHSVVLTNKGDAKGAMHTLSIDYAIVSSPQDALALGGGGTSNHTSGSQTQVNASPRAALAPNSLQFA